MESKISKELRDVYQKFVLGNSKFSHQVTFGLNFMEDSYLPSDIHKEIFLKQATEKLADFIMKKKSSFEEVSIDYKGKTYRKDLIVLDMGEFKDVVEACIKLIPVEKILEIKSK